MRDWYKEIGEWNTLCGNTQGSPSYALEARNILEEYFELKTAVKKKWEFEILDAMLDLAYYGFGAIWKAEAGFVRDTELWIEFDDIYLKMMDMYAVIQNDDDFSHFSAIADVINFCMNYTNKELKIDFDEAMSIVHEANMQKVGCPRDAMGKIIKPADFKEPQPRLEALLTVR